MNKILIILALFLSGCDVEKDAPIDEKTISKLNSACVNNGGFKVASRVRLSLIFDEGEWRVDCKDGTTFIFKE